MAYRVELANSKRAICRNTECKKQKINIDKSELRFGTWVTIQDHSSWAWKHWGCVTPVQLEGVKAATESDLDMLDGYEELPSDLQEKVKLAYENGHVADEDWRGDLSQNRPGMKGFRSPAPKKSTKKGADEEGSGDGEDGDKSPSKAASKKRGPAEKESIQDKDKGPAKKKTKVAPKKGKKVKSEQDADEMAIEEPIPAPSKATAKKGKPAKVKDFEAEEAVKSKTKAAAKKTEVAPKGEAPEDADRTAAAPKKAKAVGKKGKKTTEVEEADAEAPEQGAPPKKAAGRPSKAKHDDTEAPSPVPGGDDQPVQAGKKAGAGKNAPNTKKPVVKKAEKNAGAEKPEAPIGEAPKAKRGRNKADKSS